MNFKSKFKRMLSGVLSLAVTASIMPCCPAFADEQTESERYPYTMFAASDSEGAITINANNFCVNGNVATNGTIVSSGNMNVNGTRTENANEEMIYILKKLNHSYFSGDNVEVYVEDYSFEDLNININNPMDVYGSLELTGNINLNSGIKAYEDVTINGEVKNTNEAVICSETGDIIIETTNVNFNGLIYAPYGDIIIDTDNLNLNNVVIIGQTITLDCPNVNANYSRNTAELVGTESDIDVELYAFGEYNSEANSVYIEWYTNYSNSSYEIWISDDNVDYTSVDVVSDETTYQYPITEDFEKRYFKVSLTTNYGEYIESIPFVVTKTESGYSVDFLDSDGDGLPDVFEIMFGTSVNEIDSDDDGLTDYQEVYITGTDPTKYDSVTEGVSDADADSDEDGLSNAQELELGTDPLLSDTDDDNLSDYDEIYVYGTDPLNPDTDGDGLEDGDELHIGLDPTNPETFGIPDAEYKVDQTISTDSGVLSGINTAENAYELSIDIKTNGYAEKEVTVSKSSYSYVIENDAMIGLSADIFISDTCNPEEIVLKYNIKEAYIDNTLNLYSSLEEFQGIKRLNIFKFHEDKNMLLPVETKFDVENGLLYAEVDELGTYCIMDMEIWLNNLGVEMPKEIQNEENAMYFNSPSILSASEDSGSVWTPTYINAPIDLVFMIDSDGNYKNEFESEKSLIANICDSAFKCYKGVRVHIISCTCSSSDVIKSSNVKSWFGNINEVQKALNSIKYTICQSNSKRNYEFNTLINEVKFQDNSDRFIYMLHNHGNNRISQDSISSLDFCRMKLGIYSEILPVNWYYPDSQYEITLKQEITDNNGLFIEMDSNTLTAITENIKNNISYVRPVYEIIIPTKWKKIYLDGELSPTNGIDTDKDTLTDWEEVDTKRFIWNEDGSFDIPTFNISELICHLVRFQSDDYYFIVHNSTPHCYLPILSDPTESDTDGDGVIDSYDLHPNKRFDERFEVVDSLSYVPSVKFTEEHYNNSKTCYDSLLNIPKPYDADDDLVALIFCSYLAKYTELPGFLFSAFYHDQDISVFESTGKMNHASEALLNYLSNTGEPITYDSSEMYDLISSSPMNTVHIINNLNRAEKCSESILLPGNTICFSTTIDAGFKICCFDNKIGIEFPNGTCDVQSEEVQHSYGYYKNDIHMDWQNTVGEAFGGIVCEVQRINDHFTMNYCYYLSDIYEWAGHDDTTLLSSTMHKFHEEGRAKEFLMDGKIEGTIEWNLGERLTSQSGDYIFLNMNK